MELKSVYGQYLRKQLLQLNTNSSMRTNVGLPFTYQFCVVNLSFSLRLHLLYLAARTFFITVKETFAVCGSVLKLFYTTDSRFSALYLDENIKNRKKIQFFWP